MFSSWYAVWTQRRHALGDVLAQHPDKVVHSAFHSVLSRCVTMRSQEWMSEAWRLLRSYYDGQIKLQFAQTAFDKRLKEVQAQGN